MFNNVLEIAKQTSKGGRVPIKIALLKIHDNSTETNDNGLHWDETYVTNALDSAKMIPICAEFCDDTKTVPLGHGLTGTVLNENGISEPVFENSETVGVIETASIEMLNINGSDTKVLLGNGYLYNQRYPNFVKWVRTNYALGQVDTSIEVMGLETNDNKIIYLEEKPTDQFRTPKEFVFSGTAILSVKPADENAIVVEVAEKIKEENLKMNEKELKQLIVDTISECNDVKAESDAKIAELNETLAEKDATIAELNATVEQVQAALDNLKKEHETYWAERDLLEKELAELKVAKRLGELNEAISVYSEDEQKFAEAEINAFKENPLDGNIEEINAKICVGIIAKQKEDAKIAEQNSANKKDNEVVDIFSEINSDVAEENADDTNIF